MLKVLELKLDICAQASNCASSFEDVGASPVSAVAVQRFQEMSWQNAAPGFIPSEWRDI
jgi:hypothetical protein